MLGTVVRSLLVSSLCLHLSAADTFRPYKEGDVPQTVAELWQDYDPRREDLDVKVVKEWKAEGVVTRYITFKVCTFKGTDSRIAAFYSFPDNGRKNAAFVWSHGGGQRAEKDRGIYFAKQGFATVDINWNGKPMVEGIEENTDWGKLDASQGPRFYPKALRRSWKHGLDPDEYTIDSVQSPRNGNYFIVSLAGRRAITFLEKQPEVDAERIGFAGFSMGGMVTMLTAIDPRLKAVAPFVGGTGFRHVPWPGNPERAEQLTRDDLFIRTVDARSSWPLVKCPVMFISASNDFNAAFDRIYQSMALLKHKHWRVTTTMHENHGPGPEQWVLLDMWFKQHLRGEDLNIPATPPSTFVAGAKKATFSVTPTDQDRLVNTEVYYSYDPNPFTRFWHLADAAHARDTWSVELAVYEKLPLYVFALCRYRFEAAVPSAKGETSTFTLNSLEHVHEPGEVDIHALAEIPKTQTVFEDFKNGIQDWSTRDNRTIRTYKFQSPELDLTNKRLVFTIDPKGKRLNLQLGVNSKFLGLGRDLGGYSFAREVTGTGPQQVVVKASDFKGGPKRLKWGRISRFNVTLVDKETSEKIELGSKQGQAVLHRIYLVDAPPGEEAIEHATARGENGPSQTAAHAFDGDPKTKWLDFSPKSSWIQYDYSKESKVVTRYSITSANDAPPRDPRDWKLLGSNDGKAWITLDERKNEMWSKRYEKRDFGFENNTPYRIYRLAISAVKELKHANSVQIGEIDFLE